MKTVTVKVDELEGRPLLHMHRNLVDIGDLCPSGMYGSGAVINAARRRYGPTVEVPAELMEDKS